MTDELNASTPHTADDRGPTTLHYTPAIDQDIYCQDCGYNLRGLTSDRCPECGGSLETVRSTKSGIPWVYRREIGYFRAYWRTVNLAMSRRRSFIEEVARPVSFTDCQRFRWVTILHVLIPLILLTITAYPVTAARLFEAGRLGDQYWGGWAVLGINVWALLFLLAVTGAPSYLFHPKSVPVPIQNRAIAMSYYACAPLAILALPVTAIAVGLVLTPNRVLGLGLIMLGIFVPPLPILAWWSNLIRLAERIMPDKRRRRVLVAVGVPLLWIASALLISALLLSLAACIAIVIHLVG